MMLLYADYNVHYNVDNNIIYSHKIKILIQWYPLQAALHTVPLGSGADRYRAPCCHLQQPEKAT